MTVTSMTGFADLAGDAGDVAWTWEARSVNGRGLDLRLRLPEGLDSLEAAVRAAVARCFARGTVTIVLRLSRRRGVGVARLSPAGLDAAVSAALAARAAASARGLELAPLSAADLLAVPGVFEPDAAPPAEQPAVRTALAEAVEPLVAALARARAGEGAALAAVLAGQLDRMAELLKRARETAEARAGRSGVLLRTRLDAVLAGTAAIDEARLAQELALVAVRADVTEELDRLDAHVDAAQRLLAGEGPIGRKLDFLLQEFNREASTLCSKAGSAELTELGLELKVVIDQMREQVQNVE